MCNLRQHKMAIELFLFFVLLGFLCSFWENILHYPSLLFTVWEVGGGFDCNTVRGWNKADNINKALQYVGGFICSIRYFPLEFFIVLSLKTRKNFADRCDSYTLMLLTNPPYSIFPLLRIFPTNPKIPKISPSKYKPPKIVTQKTLRQIAPPNISPRGGLYLEFALEYKEKKSKIVNFLPFTSWPNRFWNANFPP